MQSYDEPQTKPKKTIFISYSHKDESYKDLLLSHLSTCAKQHNFEIWEDRQIETGTPWNDEIMNALIRSHMAVLLISKHFLSSKFVQDTELPKIKDLHENNNLKIYPIIIQSCLWKDDPWIKNEQVQPIDGKPLAKFKANKREEQVVLIVKDIQAILENHHISSESLSHQESQQSNDAKQNDGDQQSKPQQDQNDNAILSGSIVHLLCNRETQAQEFLQFFLKKCNDCPKKPQFYFIYGCEKQSHDNFIKRLCFHEIYGYLQKKNKSKYPYQTKTVTWPKSGKLELKKQILKSTLFNAIYGMNYPYVDETYPLTDLFDFECIKNEKDNIVIIPHKLSACHWDCELLAWYIATYWNQIDCQLMEEKPQFLLFFLIDYPLQPKRSFMSFGTFQKRINKQFNLLHNQITCINKKSEGIQSTNSSYVNECAYKIIEELNLIDPNDVENWFLTYMNLSQNQIEHHTKVIMNNSTQCDMAYIENKLKAFVFDYLKPKDIKNMQQKEAYAI